MLDFGPSEKLLRGSFMKDFAAFLGHIVGVALGAIAFMLVLAWPTMWLWNNALEPAVVTLRDIDYWQAFQIILVCRVLFGRNDSTGGKG